MHVFIASREQPLFSGKVKKITLPGALGPFQVLEQHSDIVSLLEKGNIVYSKTSGEKVVMPIEGGIARVKKNQVVILIG